MEKNCNNNYYVDFSQLVGKTLTSIEGGVGNEQMTFITNTGERYALTYYQDYCASCSVEDICGDLNDIIGSPIFMAEEVSNKSPEDHLLEKRQLYYYKAKAEHDPKDGEFYWSRYEPGPDNEWRSESETWTFYKIVTFKGAVTIRWYGSSNGYYSETATFEKLGDNNGN